MAASAKTITLDSANIISDWTVVLPRPDFEMDRHRETKLMQKIQICIEKLENSTFYHAFFRVLGSELKMQMVVYGIGSIESYEPPRLQLSLAILLKRKLSWIGDIEVLDPILSVTELEFNEQGRRHASKPTPFFMPHCEAELYDNLVQANWRTERLNNIVLFGNSFGTYEQHASEFRSSTHVDSSRHILATVSDDYFGAFHDSSWHFFSLLEQLCSSQARLNDD
ncbi:hypothetical protein AAG906_019716 [Vitis piasezkii]